MAGICYRNCAIFCKEGADAGDEAALHLADEAAIERGENAGGWECGHGAEGADD